MNQRKRNPGKRRKNSASTIDINKILGNLFASIFEDAKSYPPPDMKRAAIFFADTDTMWKKIMMLCHPDKHQGSELSQEVTRWLIENRPKTK